jgi:hypothetical protein
MDRARHAYLVHLHACEARVSDTLTFRRGEVVKMLFAIQREQAANGGSAVDVAFRLYPQLALMARTPSQFEAQAAAAKRPSTEMAAVSSAKTDPAIPVVVPSDR